MPAIPKSETLMRWRSLRKTNPLKHMNAIPYKARGSRYGACGIRIDGTPAFIDAVLSNLQDLLDGENAITRLELARSDVDGSTLGKSFENRDIDAQVCYIRLHKRGSDAQALNAMFDRAGCEAAQRMIDL